MSPLKYDADIPTPEPVQPPGGQAGHGDIIDRDTSCGGMKKACQQMQQRGFAAARSAFDKKGPVHLALKIRIGKCPAFVISKFQVAGFDQIVAIMLQYNE